mgnify:CR=1 FL=1
MPPRTNTDKIEEIEKSIAIFGERLNHLREDTKSNSSQLSETTKAFAELKTEIALLRKELEGLQKWKEELKKVKEETVRRVWAFGPNVLGAIVSVLLGALVSAIVAYLTLQHK